ncbi:MAG: M48 family metallopeptidase [Candidatus Taylorbacteria bacterium]
MMVATMFRFINPFARKSTTITGVRIFNSVYRTRSRKLYNENKENARKLISERVIHFLSYYEPKHGIKVGKIAIRNQKSRWGSCSKKGNLNFNYKLVFLEPSIRDYVIVHEICHIKEFNHGRGFWDLVAETVPDYREIRKRLRGLR